MTQKRHLDLKRSQSECLKDDGIISNCPHNKSSSQFSQVPLDSIGPQNITTNLAGLQEPRLQQVQAMQSTTYPWVKFVSNKAINLSKNNNSSMGKEHHNECPTTSNHPVDIDAKPLNGPILPPKKKLGVSRQLSESSIPKPRNNVENSPNLITDVMHQRLLPKENCVTNILYARRLPSPPVFRRKYSQEEPKNLFARDDQFVEKKSLDSSCFSPNRRYCNNPYVEIETLNTPNSAASLYCPLCVNSFGYGFGLECHLLSAHQDVLRVAQNEPHFVQDVLLDRSEWCPCCSAQFLSSGLLIKHLVSAHSEYILGSLNPECFSNRNMNPLRQQLQCNFCGQTFQRRHQKIFVQHIESKHMGELEAFLMSKDLLFQNDGVNKEGQKRNESERRMSMEVKLMLSLSKTVTFSLKKNNSCPENKKSGVVDATDNHTTSTLNRKDRFGSLRSSLRRKKHNSGGNNNSQGGANAKEATKPKISTDQSLTNDKQFIQFSQLPQFTNDRLVDHNARSNMMPLLQNNITCKNTFQDTHNCTPSVTREGRKTGKRLLRFSIPEVVHHYQNPENDDRNMNLPCEMTSQPSSTRTKRDRVSVDDISTHHPKEREDRRRMKSLERPHNIHSVNHYSRSHSQDARSVIRQPQYHKHNKMEDTSNTTKGTPFANKTRGSHFSSSQSKSKLQPASHVPYIPSTYRHIPQPEPPPPLFKTLELGNLFPNKSGDPNALVIKKNSLVSEEEFESLSSANSSTASTNSSITPKEIGDLSFNSRSHLSRWNTLKETNPFIPLQITEQFHDQKDEGEESQKLFKCNLCEVSFADNVILLSHLKNRHRSSMTKALKPQFSCGVCPAKFFKNSFLIKHCETHERTR